MPKRAVCAMCEERPRTKMASFYWAWFWPTGDRRAYKQLMDPTCAGAHIGRVDAAERDNDLCVHCGGAIDAELYQALYLTLYIPGQERKDFELPYHQACFEKDADLYVRNATRLLDRPQLGAGGPPPQVAGNPWESWAHMGIEST